MHTHESLLSIEPAHQQGAVGFPADPWPIRQVSESNDIGDAIEHPFGMTGQAIDLFPLTSFPSTRREWLIAQGDGGAAALDREQVIETHRISDTDNVTGRVVVEPHRHVKIHLLICSEAIHSARIQE